MLFYGGGSLEVGNTSAGGTTGNYEGEQTYTSTSGCLPHGCYKLVTYDTWGDGWNDNGSFTVTNQFGEVLVPQTVMSPTSGNDPDGTGYDQRLKNLLPISLLVKEVVIPTVVLIPRLQTIIPKLLSTIKRVSSVKKVRSMLRLYLTKNITTDEVFVYNETDTVFSVTGIKHLGRKRELICVPVGCYNVSMASNSAGGWTDGSQLQILDDLTAGHFFLDVDGGSLDIAVVSLGGGRYEHDQIAVVLT